MGKRPTTQPHHSCPRKSNGLFRRAAEHSAIGMALLNPEGSFLDVNPALAGMLGRESSELLGTVWQDFAHPEEPEELQQQEEVLEGRQQSYRQLKRYQQPTGRAVWGDLSMACVRNRDRSIRCFLVQVVDVTRSVAAQEALGRSQAQLAAAQRIAHLGSWTWNPATDQVEWSEEMFRIYGLEPSDRAPGFARQRAFYSESCLPRLEADLARARAENGSFETPLDILRPSGEVRHAISRGEVLADGSGRLQGTVQDVTELVLAERALRESEERYARLFDTVHETIALLTPVRDRNGLLVDHEIEWVNQAWLARFGWEGRDPRGHRVFEVLPDFMRFLPLHDAVLATGVSQRVDVRLLDGRWLDVEFTRLGGQMVAVSRDISDRKAAEEALRTSRAELAETQRIAHVGSWTWEPGRDESWWSEEMFRLFGLDPGPVPPPLVELLPRFPPESRGRLLAAVTRLAELGEAYQLPLEVVRPDGTTRHVIARGEGLRGGNGRLASTHGTFLDVTELREAEARLGEARRAELIGRLAGGAAHEFNNLVMAINGYAELLAESLAAEDPRRADAEAIGEAGSRAALLTRKLLAFGRRQVLMPRAVDLCDVVAGLAPMLRSLLGGAVLVSARKTGPTCLARADQDLLEEAITNLVLNARDAMPGGGQLDLEVSAVTLPAGDPRLPPTALPGDYLRLAVRDTGVGIPPEVLPHVFDPFFTTKDFGEAHGLGLCTVEGVIAQMGGFITAESEVGVGSTFSLHLPRWLEEAVPGRPGPPVAPPSLRVLVVDDEPGVRNVMARMLRKLGHLVVEAGDPGHALAIARAEARAFEVLVTDMVMPGMDGRTLARELQALQEGLVVVYVSGYSPEHLVEEGLLEEDTPLLTKPFDRLELAARIEQALAARPEVVGAGSKP